MTGLQWLNKLKTNNLNDQEEAYLEAMMSIAEKCQILAIPAGGWSGLSSQNYKDHRNDTFLHLHKPEKMSAKELADLTAIYCHKQLRHPIIGECHGLQAYHLYHGGELLVFKAGIKLRCLEDPSLVLIDGVFQHESQKCQMAQDASWHQDWNHNTYAILSDNISYQGVETSHPLQSKDLTWIAEPCSIRTTIGGIHAINGLNHWVNKHNGGFKVAIKEQAEILGAYVNRDDESDLDYESDGERGDLINYKSRLSKIEIAASWAKIYESVDDMFTKYKPIILTVHFNTALSMTELERDFKQTIFKHIARAYIEEIPGNIITRIEHNNDYLTQYHPSKSTNIESGLKEIKSRADKFTSNTNIFFNKNLITNERLLPENRLCR
ncbi:hypothetical protein L3V83_06195 [Thiotrichales bacterium 19X7-9]|nr:hypothetical protein [Thiotrichales bacterium 19X7-9]